jgi:hypothetical protein
LRLCGSLILTAETQRKFKRKNLCDFLRLCGSKIFTAEAQRKNQETLFFATLSAFAVENQLTTK